jgi:4-diphosphocytidyl-2-C-methyl-D-erythritol kinase
MEAYVFSAYPEVDQLKERFLRMGAVYAAMSGSGSTVFGLFRRRPDPSPLGDALLLLSKL